MSGSEVTRLLGEAEPEIVDRVAQLVRVMEENGLQPTPSLVLAFFVMGAALLMQNEYKPDQVRLVLDGVLPFAESVRDELLTDRPAHAPPGLPQAPRQ